MQQKKISVTFDSNVWEKVVDDTKRASAPAVYSDLLNAIKAGVVAPYFFEGILSLENLEKKIRKAFFAAYKPTVKYTYNGNQTTTIKGTTAPIASLYLSDMIPKAT